MGNSAFDSGWNLRHRKISEPANVPGFTAKLSDGMDDLRVDLSREHALDELDGVCVGHAKTLDKFARQPGRIQRAGDRFPAAMHHDRINAGCLQKDNVPRDSDAERSGSGESMKLPPYLMTKTSPRKRCI